MSHVTVTFPYQFFDRNALSGYRGLPHSDSEIQTCIVPRVRLTEDVERQIMGHFDDVNDELECSQIYNEGAYCLDGFRLVSKALDPRVQAVLLLFEGDGDRELLLEFLSLPSLFGAGEFLASDDVLILFHENQHSNWSFHAVDVQDPTFGSRH